MTRQVSLEVRLVDEGWTTVTFDDIDELQAVGAPGDDGLTYTLVGLRDGELGERVYGVLDVAERHRVLLDTDLPTTDDGTAIPVAQRRAGSENGEG